MPGTLMQPERRRRRWFGDFYMVGALNFGVAWLRSGSRLVQSWRDRVLFRNSPMPDPAGMESETIIRGSFCEPGRRDFTALEEFVRDVVTSRFRWIFEVELDDGARMDIYEHRETIRYLYVSEDGRAFEWVRRGHFREIDPWEALMDACEWWWHQMPPASGAPQESPA